MAGWGALRQTTRRDGLGCGSVEFLEEQAIVRRSTIQESYLARYVRHGYGAAQARSQVEGFGFSRASDRMTSPASGAIC